MVSSLDLNSVKEIRKILEQKNFSNETLAEFNLYFCESHSKCKTDLLWERLSLPIHGFSGRTIAHAGRRLESRLSEIEEAYSNKYTEQSLVQAKVDKWKKSKWINEPYDKSKNIFNMHRAYPHIIQKQYCIIVEGYWDVMALYNKGIYNVVSICGVNLSMFHAMFIKSLCHKCLFIYDSDDAGEKGSENSVDTMNALSMDSVIIELPQGMDPDDYVLNKKSSSLSRVFDEIYLDDSYKITLS